MAFDFAAGLSAMGGSIAQTAGLMAIEEQRAANSREMAELADKLAGERESRLAGERHGYSMLEQKERLDAEAPHRAASTDSLLSQTRERDEEAANKRGFRQDMRNAPPIGTGLTALSEKYESGGKTDITGYDSGGKTSYGRFQITTANMPGFLQRIEQADPELAARLRANGAPEKGGTSEDTWKGVAKDKDLGPRLREAEQKYINETHYAPALEALRKQGIDVDKMSDTAKSIVFSTAVQHGSENAAKIIGATYRAAGGDDAKFINDAYDKRKEFTSNLTPGEKTAVIKRLDDEKADALKMANGGAGLSRDMETLRSRYPEKYLEMQTRTAESKAERDARSSESQKDRDARAAEHDKAFEFNTKAAAKFQIGKDGTAYSLNPITMKVEPFKIDGETLYFADPDQARQNQEVLRAFSVQLTDLSKTYQPEIRQLMGTIQKLTTDPMLSADQDKKRELEQTKTRLDALRKEYKEERDPVVEKFNQFGGQLLGAAKTGSMQAGAADVNALPPLNSNRYRLPGQNQPLLGNRPY